MLGISDEILSQAQAATAPMQMADVRHSAALTPEQLEKKYAPVIESGKLDEALQDAVKNNDLAGAEYLLNKGANVNGGDVSETVPHLYAKNGKAISPPLLTAVKNANTDMIDLLVRHNADIDALDNNSRRLNSLQTAIEKNDEKTVTLVLEKHPDIAATDTSGRNSVHYAAEAKEPILQKVLDAGGIYAIDALSISPDPSKRHTPLLQCLSAFEYMLYDYCNLAGNTDT